MLLEAQRRGYELHYMEMNDLYLINGESRARTRTLSVEQNYDKWYAFTGEQDLPLADLDVILMRKDPPFDTEFIYATYILERAEEKVRLSSTSRRACATVTKSCLPHGSPNSPRKRW